MKTYVINLDRQPERLAKFQQQNAWLNAERFPAIDGNLAFTLEFYSPHSRGNALSHIELWKRVAAGDEPVLIAEDDAVILEADYVVPPSFLALGYNWDAPLVLEDEKHETKTIHLNQDLLRTCLMLGGAPVLPKLHSWPLVSMFGTCAYILTPDGARWLRKHLLPLTPDPIVMRQLGTVQANLGLDCALNEVHSRLGSRVLFPPMAFVANDRLDKERESAAKDKPSS